jgi:propionate CoA-transferase
MDFRPIIRDPIAMDAMLFRPEPMALAQILLGMSLSERITYDPARNTMFINWEGFEVRTTDEVELVRREVETRCRAIGRKLAMVINYDQFYLDPAVSDAFFSMITYLQQRYYTTASRYTTSAFMRLKLGASLSERALAPHVFETLPEAQANSDEDTSLDYVITP